ncbi:hypothetical protein BD414DRAFT_485557 [Trametes punicea]|nr:hypothetical protein BD414DRAFT_485557 [Trametes punicea]
MLEQYLTVLLALFMVFPLRYAGHIGSLSWSSSSIVADTPQPDVGTSRGLDLRGQWAHRQASVWHRYQIKR